VLPSNNLKRSSVLAAAGAAVLGVLGLVSLRKRRMDEQAGGGPGRSN
jgi:LPXTG-motif cell wall-anchored protein